MSEPFFLLNASLRIVMSCKALFTRYSVIAELSVFFWFFLRATPPPPCSPTKTSSWTTAVVSLFIATALALVLWCQRCASASVRARTSLRPPTIASERTGTAFCSAVHPVTCRFTPVSSASIHKIGFVLERRERKIQGNSRNKTKQIEICTIQTQILKFTEVARMFVLQGLVYFLLNVQ